MMGRKRRISTSSNRVQSSKRRSSTASIKSYHGDLKEHPLLNELVLTNLFKYCQAMPDLSSGRLVCKTWHGVSLSTWRSSTFIRLFDVDSDGKNVKMDNGTSLREFLHLWGDYCGTHPFPNFTLHCWNFDENMDENMIRFWEVAGKHIKALVLIQCKSSKSQNFFKIINSSCPNLETLTLAECTFSSKNIRKNKMGSESTYTIPINGEHPHLKSLSISFGLSRKDHSVSTHLRVSFLELLSHFPYINHFAVLAERNPPHEILSFLKAVKQIRQQGDDKLTNLQFGTRVQLRMTFEPLDQTLIPDSHEFAKDRNKMPKETLDIFRELQIPVTSISLGDFRNEQDIKNVIKLSRNALTTLIADMNNSPRCNFPFGVDLDNLRTFAMSECFCHSLDFLKYTPNLELLEIYDEISISRKHAQGTNLFVNTSTSLMENVQLLKLTDLDFRSIVNEEELNCLTKWLPRVTELGMFLDNQQFSIICQNWKALTSLQVYGSQLTDEGITGMKRVTRSSQSGRAAMEGVRIVREKGVRPNITFLKKLQSFESPHITLSDASIWHGFLKMESLSRLSIDAKLFSTTSKSALKQNNIKITKGIFDLI